MTNYEAIDRFDGYAKGAQIDKLFWIAGSLENRDLKEVVEEMDNTTFKLCFGFKSPKDINERIQSLIGFEKVGLLAEIHIPKASNFSYKEGKPIGWSSHSGHCRVEYVYGETRQELMSQIESRGNEVFDEYVKEDKKVVAS